ncbi:MAG: DUF72 domain-containing protein [Deltaproteobacteria bacterium]|nr:DUF72 domain-containing protein [Deltaproteobacteria bacterium]
MTLRIGCIDFPIPPSRYFRKWDLVEIEQTLVRAPGDGTVKRWLRESEEGFEFVVAVSPLVTYGPGSQHFRYQPAPAKSQWRKYAPFAATKEVGAAFEESLALSKELKAKLLVFQTPADLIPDKTLLRAMTHFFTKTDRQKRRWVWEPKGGWDLKEAVAFAKDMDLTLCVDPLAQLPPDPAFAYCHLPGPAGFRSRYEEEALLRLRDICRGYPDTYCLFGNIDMHNDATRFHQLVQAERA